MRKFVIGAGATGLAAGFAGGCPVFESDTVPGGMSRSYLLKPSEPRRWELGPPDPSGYRFDHGGGHWIFGLDAPLKECLSRHGELDAYQRISCVFFSRRGTFVPFPIQNHLHCLEPAVARQCLEEILHPPQRECLTQAEWLEASFGPTLNALFFAPFHERYTAGLWTRLAPQDAYKSPVDRPAVIAGAAGNPRPAGYNTVFHYPRNGLSRMWADFARRIDVRYDHRLVRIDPEHRDLHFAGGAVEPYDRLVSTLPLDQTLKLASLQPGLVPDPYTSVLVLNVGGPKGRRCPPDHWLYVPDSRCGLHRVGIYSNVSRAYLPQADRDSGRTASFYVERAFPAGARPDDTGISQYAAEAIRELQDWEFLQESEVQDCHWVEVAYTWTWPRSTWKQEALALLEQHGIQSIGRYGRWHFQGIADSLREGFLWGTALR